MDTKDLISTQADIVARYQEAILTDDCVGDFEEAKLRSQVLAVHIDKFATLHHAAETEAAHSD